MNYSISVLFRAIPLFMALFCFAYGAFIFFTGDDANSKTAGPVLFFLGSICIALFCTAATIIRQIIHTYDEKIKIVLPVAGYSAALITLIFGIIMIVAAPVYFVVGNVVSGLGLITACVSTAATVSAKFALIPENNRSGITDVNTKAYGEKTEMFFKLLTGLFALVAWIWAFILLSGASATPHFVAGTVMGGIACICTSLIALVASIIRQERNVYHEKDKQQWPRLVLVMGSIALLWGMIILVYYYSNVRDFVGYVMVGLGLVCYSISSKVILLAKVWRSDYPLAARIPLIPVLTALCALFLAAFLFQGALLEAKYFVPARVLAGLGAICFTLFSIVSILESGTSKK